MSYPLRPKPMHISDDPRDSEAFLRAASCDLGINLNNYIRIHDEVFAFTWSKLIPLPFLFRPIDFTRLYRELRFVEADLTNLAEQLPETCPENPELCAVMSDFTGRLLKTVLQLQDICQRLYLKAEGSAEYPKARYKQDIYFYRLAVQNYRSEGSRLNRILNKQS